MYVLNFSQPAFISYEYGKNGTDAIFLMRGQESWDGSTVRVGHWWAKRDRAFSPVLAYSPFHCQQGLLFIFYK